MLSKTVADAFSVEESDTFRETEIFVRNLDKFFDCMNVRHLKEAIYKKKPDLGPDNSPDDSRLSVSTTSCYVVYVHMYQFSVARERFPRVF